MDTYRQEQAQYIEQAELLKALAHPVRLCIVKGLIEKGGCNVSTMQQCLNMPQSTISQHLAKLKAANIVTAERQGLEVIYRVHDPIVKQLIEILF
ncbi:ArsR family transcriptional regulator [Anoxybacillus tepidamans]|uniref:ArsR family transcriptional regulator n=1 Tax=Anoxybacteroides tepidamans TaxID=265948 RepID=A0A7W8MWW8_9BACL|nr:metalloregulator ArsR/SmtB family transcription factor [Anoxybacillus tepidamans]MBB5326383.1 ArsR family transcriptional regulator [Anoxybacillus tepidamans]